MKRTINSCPEHWIGTTHAYKSRNGAIYQVCRRDTMTADIIMPNGRTCLGLFKHNCVVRDPVPFSTGKQVTLMRCSPLLHTLMEDQQKA
jgi:hypothetical protein